jgi:hypothetical protein
MLTVKRVRTSDGANGVNTAVRAVVWWDGVGVGEYANYGDGAEGHMRIVNDAAWLAMTKAIPFQLEAEIKRQIAIEVERAAMRRALKQGYVVFRKPGQDKFEIVNTGSGHACPSVGRDAVMTILRRNFPGVQFYVQVSPNGWTWSE